MEEVNFYCWDATRRYKVSDQIVLLKDVRFLSTLQVLANNRDKIIL